MILAIELTDIGTILNLVLAVLTILSVVIAIIFKLKAGDWKGAAEEAGKLNMECAKALDTIKTKTEGTPARAVVADTLKATGAELEKAGLKSVMDAKLRELGLTEKS
jgi:hypothetical protein